MPDFEMGQIEEAYMVRSEAMNLYAVLSQGEESFAVNGWVWFKDEKPLYFHDIGNDRGSIRDKLEILCLDIAEFYQTNVFRMNLSN